MDAQRVLKGLDVLQGRIEHLLEQNRRLATENRELSQKRDDVRQQVEELIEKVDRLMGAPAKAPRAKKRGRKKKAAASR